MLRAVNGTRLILFSFFLLALTRCGSDPSLETGTEGNEPDGGGDAGGGDAGGVPNVPDPGIDVPGGGGERSTDGGMGGTCSGPDCDGTECGNAEIDDGEICDDGNARPGDGCSGLCRVEPNFRCDEPGEACESTVDCGDGEVAGGEACDDGNPDADDGCSDECQVEQGYACETPGEPCTEVTSAECGDGAVNFGETCDDGNTDAEDGCSDECALEPGYRCPEPGELCELLEYCGDGALADAEQCDDGNTTPGDGCTGLCSLEPFYTCPVPGELCETSIVCGDELVVGDEACDDGNTNDDDGCAADCSAVEPGWVCPNDDGQGGECEEAMGDVCGNAIITFGEYCDDGNTNPNDGCTEVCEVTPGYDCPNPGELCERIGWCGNGEFDPELGEQCDDGDDPAVGGDGCSELCQIEDLFSCPLAGPCVSLVVCGDGIVVGTELCDDGNHDEEPLADGDGCSTTCQTEPGWICPPGVRCRAAECGDGIVAGNERCDDDGVAPDDGCSALCTVEPGFKCDDGSPSVCEPTVCGDGTVEGSEQCDNDEVAVDEGEIPAPFDGCSSTCTNEPTCGCDGCDDVCGDGMKFQAEACDDGNQANDDGCSDACLPEPGYQCEDEIFEDTVPCSTGSGQCLVLPIVYRDFKGHEGGSNENSSTTNCSAAPLQSGPHPQFGIFGSAVPPATVRYDRRPGIVMDDICASGRPVFDPDYLTGAHMGTTMNGAQPCATPRGTATLNATTAAARFDEWYSDVNGVNQKFTGTLELLPSSGRFVYDRSSSNATAALRSFFPLDGLGFGNVSSSAGSHNFNFTSEMRYWFFYGGGEEFEFRGDDDVWVFVNGQLVVDLGGIHSEWIALIRLNGADSEICIPNLPSLNQTEPTQVDTDPTNDCVDVNIPLTAGNVYEIALFQAERHIIESHYKVTLNNFNVQRTSCDPWCGDPDAIVSPDEDCDLGAGNNTGEYGGCNADCTLAPFCGDNVLQASEEECDNGANISVYGNGLSACAPGCVKPPFCGDDTLQGQYEQCDNGTDDNTGEYGECKANCTLGPRCGDGVVQSAQEECDDVRGGVNYNGTSSSLCTSTCQLKCGDGDIDPGEQCDEGESNNVGGYGNCTANCRLGPRCGDGIRQAGEGEECDDGANDGSYGTCAPGCVLGPYCGDGEIQSEGGELCDDGEDNSALSYGEALCTNRCLPAPYCGDRSVDVDFGEVCDDGVNDGSPGSCEPDCSGWVPLPDCGDGNLDPGEDCDDGAQNGSSGSDCDGQCHVKCGNGVVDSGEGCDDGVNDGSYGSCTEDCELGPYCGDGNRDSPQEQCDEGDDNQADPYGEDECTTGCARAPYCGDGRIQSTFGEACDGDPGCDPDECEYTIPE